MGHDWYPFEVRVSLSIEGAQRARAWLAEQHGYGNEKYSWYTWDRNGVTDMQVWFVDEHDMALFMLTWGYCDQ